MATKQLVENSIWNDVWFKGLSDRSKVLFLYLLINPEQTPAGIFEVDLDVISVKLKIKNPLEEIKKLAPKIVFDEEKSLVWVKNFYSKNSKGEKIQKSVQNTLEKHKKSFIATDFCDFYNLPLPFDRVSIPESICQDSLNILSNEHEHEHDNDNDINKRVNKKTKTAKKPSPQGAVEKLSNHEDCVEMLRHVSHELQNRWLAQHSPIWLKHEITSARNWIIANPDKPKKNMGAFIGSWIGRSTRPDLDFVDKKPKAVINTGKPMSTEAAEAMHLKSLRE